MSAGRILTACGLGLAVWALGAGSAAADPEPAPDPGVEAPLAAPPIPADPFTIVSTQSKDNPVGALAGLLGNETASSTMAMANQGVGLSAPPPMDPLSAIGMLYAQNFRMPSGDEMSPYVLQTNVPAGPFARVDAAKGVHALAHGSLGRVPGSELGQALPGIAPPPGTNLPPGLEQFYSPPDAPAEVPPPVPPFPTVIPAG